MPGYVTVWKLDREVEAEGEGERYVAIVAWLCRRKFMGVI